MLYIVFFTSGQPLFPTSSRLPLCRYVGKVCAASYTKPTEPNPLVRYTLHFTLLCSSILAESPGVVLPRTARTDYKRGDVFDIASLATTTMQAMFLSCLGL